MIHVTEILSRFIAELRYESLDQDVIDITKMYILDYYASCFAGMKVNRRCNKIVEDIILETGGKDEASVLCKDVKLPAGSAAFLNAFYAHGADMDDGNRKAMGHIAAHVMSTAFALAEVLNSSGKDVITAINVGYEVYNRVAAAVQPGLVRRGFHSTGTAGALACGATASKLLRLDEKGVYNALSLSAIQSAGLMLITESGQSCKPINPANAARSGIFAAQLAQKGMESSQYPLESSKGWFHAMSDFTDENEVSDGLGEKYTICDSYLKPYPSCRHTHGCIEAALKIRESILKFHGQIDIKKIRWIVVNIYPTALRVAGNIKMPETEEEAKFSVHYALASALLRGHFCLTDLIVDSADKAEICNIIEKIVIVSDTTMENKQAGVRGAKLCLEYSDGTVYEEYVAIPKGDAANPLTARELHEKLFICADGVITYEQQQRLICAVKSFEKITKYRSINALFATNERK